MLSHLGVHLPPSDGIGGPKAIGPHLSCCGGRIALRRRSLCRAWMKGIVVTSTQPLEHVSFTDPDEVREGDNWRLELLNLAGGAQVGRITVQPGWRWSQDVKPVAGTDLCMAPHQQYQLSGHMHVVMSDGAEFDTGPGEIVSLPPGHDAWVVGDESVVAIDWQGASVWAARQP